jgi:omega-6 fatty acid desaturase (delta-12 desaturase)
MTSAELNATLSRYRQPHAGRSAWQLVTAVVPLSLLFAGMFHGLAYGYGLTLLLAFPAAGFLLRVFMIQHDCGHHSFFKSRRANDVVGFLLALLTMTPYHRWRRNHLLHHVTSGDLDRRGHGDIYTMTVDEYARSSLLVRLAYRAFRNPLFLFGVAPVLHFAVLQRFSGYAPRSWARERWCGYATNVALAAAAAGLAWWVGVAPLVLVYAPVAWLASGAGMWLFFVQHHYEAAYWRRGGQWDYAEAALKGSSHLDLPPVLQWFTANIGFHHLHHLDSRIPNYRLTECLRENPQLAAERRLTLGAAVSCARLALWDERLGRMVSFRELASASQAHAHTRGKE